MELTVNERIANNVEVMELIELKHITNNLDNRRIPLNGIEREKKTKIGLYPYVGANNIQGYIDEYIFDEKILCIAEDGGSWGKGEKCAVIMNEKCWVNNHAHVLTAKDNLVLEYLMYYFNHADLSLHINGATRGKLTQGTLNSLKIPLPPLPTQQKIAKILDTADQLRQYNKQLIEKYNALTQSLFLDMFGDPVKNEKGWEKMELKNCTSKIGSGSTPRGGKEAYHTEGISLIRSLNIYDNDFKYKKLAFINDDQATKLKNVTVESNDVLFNITGASVCRCTVVPNDVLPARVNQHVSILRPISDKLHSLFLSHLLISENIKIQLLGVGLAGGAIMEAITKDQLEKFNIPVPPIELQSQFAERVQLIETQKQKAQEALAKSEDLFQSLLQKAFKGELN
ncbi:restriction endonuclease subunit S [Flavobacterium algoritolerans]|uniref:Restriction endonuclease subunit S n=1 Tax=Flavobacterium algoritolerans TaxID=3041254 RepID=A0ABT6V9B7_9FLAO|nr:restriction endonuclease subunit S [Flavobacterium algoritolerans]MDI5894804.1 restriction endonuclease subunit S [Flavobacterium algoritolerans]